MQFDSKNHPQLYKDTANNHILFLVELTKSEYISDFLLVDSNDIFPNEDNKNFYPKDYLPAMQAVAYAYDVQDSERNKRIKQMLDCYLETSTGDLVSI